ncbi:MAG: UDP-3-O-(3-hydroxymyristoyl)glucosamine N-acyltransferase [Bacteroidota bacterium]|nr:UDP-3-O-(3-hydroxymyristoyl)glucosamine N-acyltransferase [Bacteroidota bacterium]
MRFSNPVPVNEIAKKYSLKLIGKENELVYGINEIHKVDEGDITFVDAEKYYQKVLSSKASFIIINKEVDLPEGKTILVTDDPFKVYNDIVNVNRPIIHLSNQISDSAFIHPTAFIEPGAIIGHHVVIGLGSVIQANAHIGEFSVIGNHVTVQAGAIIGTDAFYYKKTTNGFQKWRSGGRVVIHDEVEIGAGCTINKGVSGDTIIGYGTKLDCQVHIGHGVVIGRHCLLAAQVGIGGKTKVGDHVILYGQVGIAQNLIIEDHVIVAAKSGVSKDLKKGKTYFGIPAAEIQVKYRELAAIRSLPEMIKKNK